MFSSLLFSSTSRRSRHEQPVAAHGDFEILAAHARHVGHDAQRVAVLAHLEAGHPQIALEVRHRHRAERIPAHHLAHEPERLPFGHGVVASLHDVRHVSLSLCGGTAQPIADAADQALVGLGRGHGPPSKSTADERRTCQPTRGWFAHLRARERARAPRRGAGARRRGPKRNQPGDLPSKSAWSAALRVLASARSSRRSFALRRRAASALQTACMNAVAARGASV